MSAAHDKTMQHRISEIEALEVFIERKMVADEDVTFVTSLCYQYRQKDFLSAKQWYWVHRMLDRVLGLEEKDNDDKTG
jgi:hypothetical protein